MERKCEVYSKIRNKYGKLTNEDDLVSFFSDILEVRERLEDEERSSPSGEGRGTMDNASNSLRQLPASLGS